MNKKEVTISQKYKIVSYRKKTDGWTKIYNSSFEYIESPTAFKVYCYLCYRYNDVEEYSSPSISEIAKDCKMSKATVQKTIKELEDLKLIIKENNKDANKYYLSYPTKEMNIEGELVVVKTVKKNSNCKTRKTDYRYIKWRNEVLERDNYICRLCGCSGEDIILNVHHIEKYAENEELRTDVNNGISLCYECHKKMFGKEKDFEEYFKTLIKQSR